MLQKSCGLVCQCIKCDAWGWATRGISVIFPQGIINNSNIPLAFKTISN